MRKILTVLAIIIALTVSGLAQSHQPSLRPPVVETVKAKHPRWRKLRHALVLIVKKPAMAWVKAMAQDGR